MRRTADMPSVTRRHLQSQHGPRRFDEFQHGGQMNNASTDHADDDAHPYYYYYYYYDDYDDSEQGHRPQDGTAAAVSARPSTAKPPASAGNKRRT